MTKRTWWFRFLTTLLIFGLAACGGSGGGGGGGGGSGIPTATNAAIMPPPSNPVAITGSATLQTNQSIAANGFQASEGAVSSATDSGSALGLVGVQADNSGTQAKRQTLRAIVRGHAEKLRDHQRSVTGAVQVVTEPCSGGGTMTLAFDDANGSAANVFVNCNEGGIVTHGTVSSSNVSVTTPVLGSTVGSGYTVSVSATIAIDLSIGTAPASTFVTQGSFTFTVGFSGKMEADGTGGVQPGALEKVDVLISGASLLTSDGTVSERLSNFGITSIDNITLGTTTTFGAYTYASTLIHGSVMVEVLDTQALVYQPGALHPSSGVVTVTSPPLPGKIVLHVNSSVDVTVGVFADAIDTIPIDTATLTWAQVDLL